MYELIKVVVADGIGNKGVCSSQHEAGDPGYMLGVTIT